MKASFKKDVIITIIGQLIVLLVTFIVNKIVSVQLGTEGYTEFSIAKRSAGVISYVMLMGLGIAVPRFIPQAKAEKNEILKRKYILSSIIILLTMSLIIILLGFFGKKILSTIIFGSQDYSYTVLSMLIFAFSTSITTLAISFYRALDQFYMYSISQIIIQFIMLLCTFFLNKEFNNLILFWGILTGIYGLLICIRIIKREKCLKKEVFLFLDNPIRKLLKYCLPRIPGEFILFAYTTVPIILINHKLGINATTPFATGITITTMISPLFSFVGIVLLPLVSKSVVEGNIKSSQNKVRKLGIVYLGLSILAILCVEIVPEVIVKVVFSDSFLGGIPIIRIMVLAVLPNAIYLLLRNPIDAVSEKAYNTFNLMISFFVLNLIIILSNNVLVYALSFFIAYSILGILSFLTWKLCCKRLKNY